MALYLSLNSYGPIAVGFSFLAGGVLVLLAAIWVACRRLR